MASRRRASEAAGVRRQSRHFSWGLGGFLGASPACVWHLAWVACVSNGVKWTRTMRHSQRRHRQRQERDILPASTALSRAHLPAGGSRTATRGPWLGWKFQSRSHLNLFLSHSQQHFNKKPKTKKKRKYIPKKKPKLLFLVLFIFRKRFSKQQQLKKNSVFCFFFFYFNYFFFQLYFAPYARSSLLIFLFFFLKKKKHKKEIVS